MGTSAGRDGLWLDDLPAEVLLHIWAMLWRQDSERSLERRPGRTVRLSDVTAFRLASPRLAAVTRGEAAGREVAQGLSYDRYRDVLASLLRRAKARLVGDVVSLSLDDINGGGDGESEPSPRAARVRAVLERADGTSQWRFLCGLVLGRRHDRHPNAVTQLYMWAALGGDVAVLRQLQATYGLDEQDSELVLRLGMEAALTTVEQFVLDHGGEASPYASDNNLREAMLSAAWFGRTASLRAYLNDPSLAPRLPAADYELLLAQCVGHAAAYCRVATVKRLLLLGASPHLLLTEAANMWPHLPKTLLHQHRTSLKALLELGLEYTPATPEGQATVLAAWKTLLLVNLDESIMTSVQLLLDWLLDAYVSISNLSEKELEGLARLVTARRSFHQVASALDDVPKLARPVLVEAAMTGYLPYVREAAAAITADTLYAVARSAKETDGCRALAQRSFGMALFGAARQGHFDVAMYLLQHHHDLLAGDLDWIVHKCNKHPDITALLLAAGANVVGTSCLVDINEFGDDEAPAYAATTMLLTANGALVELDGGLDCNELGRARFEFLATLAYLHNKFPKHRRQRIRSAAVEGAQEADTVSGSTDTI